MKKKLFQFAVLHHETVYKENNKTEIVTTIVKAPDTVLAHDEKTAVLMIAKQIPDDLTDKLQDVEILIRPF